MNRGSWAHAQPAALGKCWHLRLQRAAQECLGYGGVGTPAPGSRALTRTVHTRETHEGHLRASAMAASAPLSLLDAVGPVPSLSPPPESPQGTTLLFYRWMLCVLRLSHANPANLGDVSFVYLHGLLWLRGFEHVLWGEGQSSSDRGNQGSGQEGRAVEAQSCGQRRVCQPRTPQLVTLIPQSGNE